MRAGEIVAGMITAFLGLAGLADIFGDPIIPLDLASVGVVLTSTGALILFAVMTAIGIGLVVDGAIAEEPKVTATKVIVEQPAGKVVYAQLPELDILILRYLSQRKSEREISRMTGVDRKIIGEKISRLRAEGYLTDRYELTEKGYNAIKPEETIVVEKPEETIVVESKP